MVRTYERANGRPMAQAWATVIASDSTSRSVWTDSTGVATFVNLADGEYAVWVRSIQHTGWRGRFAARSGFTDTLDLLLTDFGPCVQE